MELIRKPVHYTQEGKKIFDQFYLDEDYNVPDQKEDVQSYVKDAIKRAEEDWVIYCDPPYAPLSTTASFTTYASGGFTLDDQAILARLARHTAAHKGVPVLISNHDIELTRELYRGARLDEILVKRTISRNGGTRNKVAELLALYPPGIEPEQGYYPGEAELVVVG